MLRAFTQGAEKKTNSKEYYHNEPKGNTQSKESPQRPILIGPQWIQRWRGRYSRKGQWIGVIKAKKDSFSQG